MKLKDVISRVDGMKPNAFSNEVKVGWVNELENMVQTEIFLLAPEEMVEYTWEKNAESELLVKTPYSKLYWIYLSAMIDFTHGEYKKYEKTMELFNTWLMEYQSWYARNFRPADGGAVQMGYYLSAYGLAKLHGYTGTVEEWLESLKGLPGEPGRGIENIEELGRDSTVDETGAVIHWTNYRITYAGGVIFDYRVRDGKNGKDGTLKFEELTPEQKAELKGDPGKALTYEDLTEAQKEELRGKAATINGVNAFLLKATEPLKLEQTGNEATLKLEGRVGGSAFFEAVIGTNWTEDSSTGVKSQTIALDGVAAKDTAHVEPRYTGDGTSEGYAAFVEQKQQFLDCITNGYAQTVDGGVKLYIFGAANTVTIPVLVEVK